MKKILLLLALTIGVGAMSLEAQDCGISFTEPTNAIAVNALRYDFCYSATNAPDGPFQLAASVAVGTNDIIIPNWLPNPCIIRARTVTAITNSAWSEPLYWDTRLILPKPDVEAKPPGGLQPHRYLERHDTKAK